MAEVKTAPVVARHPGQGRVSSRFRYGACAWLDPGKPSGQRWRADLLVRLPVRCGSLGPLTVGNGFKPADGPSWQWNGSLDKPTLTPSVHHRGHWHGWLTDGVWRSC